MDTCEDWEPQLDATLKGRHDRYIIVDEKLEIVLSSGFDHLGTDHGDFMYVVSMLLGLQVSPDFEMFPLYLKPK